jgi:hypothetical protein
VVIDDTDPFPTAALILLGDDFLRVKSADHDGVPEAIKLSVIVKFSDIKMFCADNFILNNKINANNNKVFFIFK